MSGSHSSRLPGRVGTGGGVGATTVLAAKVVFASAALAAAASLARLTVPQLVSGADSFLWKLYLFGTVHVIIFVIWKLSGSKHFHAAQQHKDPWAPTPHHPVPPLVAEEVVLSAVKRKVDLAPAARADEYHVAPSVSRPHIDVAASPVDEGAISPGSCGGESCVTTESEEDAPDAAAASVYVPADISSRSVAPPPVRESTMVERGISLPPPQAMAATDEHFNGADHDHDDASGDDDLDATWNAIMQSMRPSTAPAFSSSSHPAPRSPAQKPRPRAR